MAFVCILCIAILLIEITALGKRLGLRQRVISTAIAYFRRFYFR